MASLPVETRRSVNLILQEVSVDAGEWIKFVICPVYAVAPKQTLFAIYEAIKRQGTFSPVVLFFYILWELDMQGIAVELAKLVTRCDTVRVEDLFSSVRPNEKTLKKLRLLSLRLALAKVFLTLERTETEVENVKAALGYPSGDRSFCYILKALEGSKKISYDDCRMIEEALESSNCSTYSEELTDFLDNDNPFLGILRSLTQARVESPLNPSPLPSFQPFSSTPLVSPLSHQMAASMPLADPVDRQHSYPNYPSHQSAPAQFTPSANAGYHNSESVPHAQYYYASRRNPSDPAMSSTDSSLSSMRSSGGSSHSSYSSSDSDRRLLRGHSWQNGGQARATAGQHGRPPMNSSRSEEEQYTTTPVLRNQPRTRSFERYRSGGDGENDGGHTSRIGSTGSTGRGSTTRSNSFNTESPNDDPVLPFVESTGETERLQSQYASLSMTPSDPVGDNYATSGVMENAREAGHEAMVAQGNGVNRRARGGHESRLLVGEQSVTLTSDSSESSQLQPQPPPPSQH